MKEITLDAIHAGLRLTRRIPIKEMTDEQAVIFVLTRELAKAKRPFTWQRFLDRIWWNMHAEEFRRNLDEIKEMNEEIRTKFEEFLESHEHTAKILADLPPLPNERNND